MSTNYTPSGNPTAETRGISSQVRAEFQLIANAVNVKGDRTGETWTGTHDFTGGTLKAATATFGATGNAVATLDFVNLVATNAALPGQSGNLGKIVTTNGTSASWTDKLNASVMKWADGTDPTKLVQMDLSGITTGTTRKVVAPDRDVMLGGFANMVVLRSTQSWTPPYGVTIAEVSVVDGGTGGTAATSGAGTPGTGGKASTSIIAVSASVTYTATIGSGGTGGPANTTTAGTAGGASSFSGTGITTLTSSNGTLVVAGGLYGDSLFASTSPNTLSTNGVAPGQGGSAGGVISRAGDGAAGAIIIKY